MDIATITYRDDVAFLKLQARSIELYFNHSDLGDYVIIINERDPAEVRGIIERDILPLMPSVAPKVRLVTPHDLGLDLAPDVIGWRIQQALKLAVNRICPSQHVLILDSKNHFIQPVSRADFLDDQGRFIAFFKVKTNRQARWLDHSRKLLKMTKTPEGEFSPATTPPYVFDTQVGRDLVDHLEKTSGKDIATFFQSKDSLATEFFLYYAFVLKTFGTHEKHYVPVPDQMSATFFRIWPERRELIDAQLAKALKGKFKIFGVHRGRIALLEPQDIDRICQLWVKCRLLPDEASGRALLDEVAEREAA